MTAHQAPPSLGFSRQEPWSGLPFPSPMHESEKWKWSRSVMYNSQRPHGLQSTRLLHPWDFPGTGVGCHCLLCKPVYPKGNQSWILIERTDPEAETTIFWLPAVKNWLIGKDPDGKDWWQQQNGVTEDDGVNGITDSMTMSLSKPWEIQGSLVGCRLWDHIELDTTEAT